MSKKSKRQAALKAHAAGGARKTSPNKAAPAAQTGAKAVGHGHGGISTAMRNAPSSVTLLAARIGGLVVAVLALAGGIAWAMGSPSFSAGLVVGLVALGILAGLAIFTAVRTEVIVARVMKLAAR